MLKGIWRIAASAIVLLIFIVGGFAGGYGVSHVLFPPAPGPDGGAPVDWQAPFKVFWEAWSYVHQDFYKTPINDSDLVNGSIGGMVNALGDPHTIFIDAQAAAIEQSTMQGSFEGIGATVEMREGRLAVVSPIKDSPAEHAGLLPDDIILQVDDTVIQNMDVNQAVALIRGPKGSTVKLLIQRAKVPNFTVSIVRDTIRTYSVDSRMIPNTQIGYVALSQFTATAPQELDDALTQIMAQKPTGLILDLRRDPGGYLESAIAVANEFLKADQVVVVVKDKSGVVKSACADNRGRPAECKTAGGGQALNIPLVLLVDKGSASASEIVSAALKDYKRATLIGTVTYGKGSVQNVHILSDKSELNVTTAHFFSPLGKEIDGIGVTPDIQVQITDDDVANKRDSQLDRAIQFLQNGK